MMRAPGQLQPRLAPRLMQSLACVAMLLAAACSVGSRPSAAPARVAEPVASAPLAPRVLLISLDGFRWDYVDRAEAVRLRRLAARGVRADRLIPAFPSKTFPNHYTLVTGLTPEEHGIVANAMRDPELGLFRTSNVEAQRDPRWWGGEPIWVTAEKQGRRAGSFFWPGSETKIDGVGPTWYKRYQHDLPHWDRTEGVLEWLALPPDSAPAIITLYFSDTDDAGHWFGPDAPETDDAIARVDRAIGTLVDGIARLGLTDVVNILIVADHGMTAVSNRRTILIDDYLDLSTVDIVDWTPVAAIVPRAGDEERVYQALLGKHPNLQVYRKGEVPARWHFNAHPRITPIVAVADEGWTITTRPALARANAEGRTGGGAHGYDPELISMGAVFIAAGPGIAEGRRIPAFRNIHVYPLMAHLLGLVPARTSGSLDSVRAVLR